MNIDYKNQTITNNLADNKSVYHEKNIATRANKTAVTTIVAYIVSDE